MTHYAIVTDLNRCVGCLHCSVACKVENDVPIGSFWNKTLRVGPNDDNLHDTWPNGVEMYFLTVSCQHCYNPECVTVCPTGASHIIEDGTIQIDKEKCIGCQFCAMACPYNVRYLNEESGIVEKCTMCEQLVSAGELPQCVSQCGGRARFFGDIEQGIENMEGPFCPTNGDYSYDSNRNARIKLGDYVNAFNKDQVYALPDVGNEPSFLYILRDRTWKE